MSVEKLPRVYHIKEVKLGQDWHWRLHEGLICWGALSYSQLLKGLFIITIIIIQYSNIFMEAKLSYLVSSNLL